MTEEMADLTDAGNNNGIISGKTLKIRRISGSTLLGSPLMRVADRLRSIPSGLVCKRRG